MRYLLIIGVTLLLPLSTSAEGIHSTTQSSSQSGAVVSGKAVTSGNSSASAHVRTMVGGGGAYMEVTTEVDGVQYTELRQGTMKGSAGASSPTALTKADASDVQSSPTTPRAPDASTPWTEWFLPFRALFRNFFGFLTHFE